MIGDRNPMIRARVYRARRLVQTPRTFTNWVSILRDMALGRAGKGPAELVFDTRSGIRINTPNRPGARVPIYEIFAEDCYRLEWFLDALLTREIQVMDIGGHVGTFSCRLAQLHPRATISAFEPSSTTASFLRRNVKQNGFADRVTVTEAALAATSGFAVFDDNGAGSGLNGLAAVGHSSGATVKVKTIGFDTAVRDAAVPVDVVKIDCEGGEFDLILNSNPASWTSVQRVVIESHPVDGHHWGELRAWFADVGLAVQEEISFEGYGCAWLSRAPLPTFAG